MTDKNKVGNSKAGLTDVHVHLQDKRFGTDLRLIFERASESHIDRFLCSATVPSDWSRVQSIGQKNRNVSVTFGIHPWYVDGVSGDWENWLRLLLTDQEQLSPFLPGVGEIGLDFAIREKTVDRQEDFFRRQLAIAEDLKRPVVLHTVRAVDRTLEILEEYRKISLYLFHGFVGTVEQIEKIVDLGGFFSFGRRNIEQRNTGAIETVRHVPRDRILLESDGPTLLPKSPKAPGQAPVLLVQEIGADGFLLDEPAQITQTIKELARIKDLSEENFLQQIIINEKRFFNNWPKKQ